MRKKRIEIRFVHSKICECCGSTFYRREGEAAQSFRIRKKCRADCRSRTWDTAGVLSACEFRDDHQETVILETGYFTATWFSQSKHWRKFY